MALNDLDVVYDDKAFGNIIDPTQWNANFKLIETITNSNNIIINGHHVNFSNPHQVTKIQVGLTNVDDVKQATKAEFDTFVSRTDNPHGVTAAQLGVYTQTQMQTTGQAALHWGNLTNVPNLADAHWKASVANRAALPLTGNGLGDQRVVLDDGDGKQAVYLCIATTGDVDAQWEKIADVDFITDEATRVAQEEARVIAEGGRVTAEGLRVTADSTRTSNENSRISAEESRVTVEGARVTAEGNRVSAEVLRETVNNARAYIGVYDSGTTYVVGNQVTYNGSTYRCVLASTGNLPTNATYWILVAVKGTDGYGAVEDVLTSTSAVNALSAKQGKNLKDTADTLANIVSTKSAKSTIQNKTLSSASWTGTSAPYSYSLTVTGVTTTSIQEVLPTTDITNAQLTALLAATLQDGGQSANTMVLYAWGTKPAIDLPIRVILRGDI